MRLRRRTMWCSCRRPGAPELKHFCFALTWRIRNSSGRIIQPLRIPIARQEDPSGSRVPPLRPSNHPKTLRREPRRRMMTHACTQAPRRGRARRVGSPSRPSRTTDGHRSNNCKEPERPCAGPLHGSGSLPECHILKGTTLDDPSWIKPTLHIWCDSAQPWDTIPEGATCLPRNPPPG